MTTESSRIDIAVAGSGIAKRKHSDFLVPGFDGRLRVAAATQLAKIHLNEGTAVRLILLGGESNPQQEGHSEASVMQENLVRRYGLTQDHVTYALDGRSRNTVENIRALLELVNSAPVILITNEFHVPRVRLALEILRLGHVSNISVQSAESILRQSNPHYRRLAEAFAQEPTVQRRKRTELGLLFPTLLMSAHHRLIRR